MKPHVSPKLRVALLVTAIGLPLTATTWAQRGGDRDGGQRTRGQQAAPIPSPAPTSTRQRPGTQPPPPQDGQALEFPTNYRSVDGSDNNLQQPDRGSVGVALLRRAAARYVDGVSAPSGENRPSARAISNACAAQDEDRPNAMRASDYLWQWGQFVDHDIDLTHAADPAEAHDIAVPAGDAEFDPQNTGTQVIAMDRSDYAVDANGVRQQVNSISAFIDGSNVYGADETRAAALRTLDGTGRLKTSPGDLLPFNEAGLDNAPSAFAPNFFLAGDIRANEQAALASIHTLFVREHNHWAQQLMQADSTLSGEDVYQMARVMVIAEIQAITYNEFLTLLLGEDAVPPFQGYNPNVNPGIANAFSTAAFRLGHSMLSTTLLRVDRDGSENANGHLPLASAFFNPALLTDEGGIDPIMRGLAQQVCQEIDNLIVDDVRNFLFGAPGAGGFDLASLNIQRGRDHGLASYNDARQAYGLPRVRQWRDIHPDPQVQAKLREVYSSVNDIDLWVGGLAERHAPGAMVGPTYLAILADQFRRLRDGDRFWYEAYLSGSLQNFIEDQTLARIIRRNTSIGDELQDDVFRVPSE
ncbi:MAG: peroxidase [Verrucomicrobiales bacterium]|jgi:peroxidase